MYEWDDRERQYLPGEARPSAGGSRNYVLVGAVSAVAASLATVLLVPWLAYPRLSAMVQKEVGAAEARLEAALAEARRPDTVTQVVSTTTAALEAARLAGSANGLPAVTQVTLAAEAAGPAVVGVVAGQTNPANSRFHGGSETLSHGSGLVFDARGHVITNHHVVNGASLIKVVFPDGRRLDARLVGADPNTDLAVIKVDAEGLTTAQLGNSDLVRIGDLAIAIGNPVSLEFQRTVTAGIISGLNRSLRLDNRTLLEVMQADAAISPGNSGGPLVNALGQVIGITTAKLSLPDVEGMGFAIPINTVTRIADQLIVDGKVTRSWLGVLVYENRGAPESGAAPEPGVLVAETVEAGPAQGAGIKAGDVILVIDDRSIDDYSTLRSVLESRRVGDDVVVTVKRDKETLKIPLKLGKMPD